MKCLTFRHLLYFLTLLSITASTEQAWANAYGLPRELTIKVGNTEIRGFLGNAESVKEDAAENQEDLPPEGFVYQVERGPDPKIQLAVWSISKREGLILKAAEEKLTQLVYQQQVSSGESPGGFLFSDKEGTSFGNEPPKKKIAKKAPENVALKPVLAEIGKETPTSTLVETANGSKINPLVYWLLLALLVLIGVVWGDKRSS